MTFLCGKSMHKSNNKNRSCKKKLLIGQTSRDDCYLAVNPVVVTLVATTDF